MDQPFEIADCRTPPRRGDERNQGMRPSRSCERRTRPKRMCAAVRRAGPLTLKVEQHDQMEVGLVWRARSPSDT